MAFNPDQFKAKKKRPYTGPPRPNLMTHEKKMKEAAIDFEKLKRLVLDQQAEIERLRAKLAQIESTTNMLVARSNRAK